jgi:hypothetical protein
MHIKLLNEPHIEYHFRLFGKGGLWITPLQVLLGETGVGLAPAASPRLLLGLKNLALQDAKLFRPPKAFSKQNLPFRDSGALFGSSGRICLPLDNEDSLCECQSFVASASFPERKVPRWRKKCLFLLE